MSSVPKPGKQRRLMPAVVQDWTSTIICISGCLYIISCTPWLLASSGLLGTFCVFLTGMLVAAVGLTVLLVWLLYKSTDVFDPIRERMLRQQKLGRAAQASLHSGPTRSSNKLPTHAANRRMGFNPLQRVRQCLRRPNNASVTGMEWGKDHALDADAVVDGKLLLGTDAQLPPDGLIPDIAARPQPETWNLGCYAGVIWTVPASTWSPYRLCPHPPVCEGPDAISHRWHAHLAHGVLTLKPAYGRAWNYGHSQPAHPPPILPPQVDIPLEGCEVDIVRECLNGRTTWLKTAPLVIRLKPPGNSMEDPSSDQSISNDKANNEAQQQQTSVVDRTSTGEQLIPVAPASESDIQAEPTAGVSSKQPTTRQLLYGETCFYFFAESGAAKEQWLAALQVACGMPASGNSILSARATYAAFCAALATLGPLNLPRANDMNVQSVERDASNHMGIANAASQAARQQSGKSAQKPAKVVGKPTNQPSRQGSAQQNDGKQKGGGAFGWVRNVFNRRGRNPNPNNQQQQQQLKQQRSEGDKQPAESSSKPEDSNPTPQQREPATSQSTPHGNASHADFQQHVSAVHDGEAVHSATEQTHQADTDVVVDRNRSADQDADDKPPEEQNLHKSNGEQTSSFHTDAATGLPDLTKTSESATMSPFAKPAEQGLQQEDSLNQAISHDQGISKSPVQTQGRQSASGLASKRMLSASVPDLRALGMETSNSKEPGSSKEVENPTRNGNGSNGQPTQQAAMSTRLSLDSVALQKYKQSQQQPATAETEPLPSQNPDSTETIEDSNTEPKCRHFDGKGGNPRVGVAIEGMFGLNMLLVRLGYEFLRARWFTNWLHMHVQKLLDNMKRPAYIQPLCLEGLDLGSSVPLIKAVRAVAGPANACATGGTWPQLALDIVYSGGACLTVSTKVELQRAGMFHTLQSTLARLQGHGGGGGEEAGGISPTPATGNGMPRGLSPASSFATLSQAAQQSNAQQSMPGRPINLNLSSSWPRFSNDELQGLNQQAGQNASFQNFPSQNHDRNSGASQQAPGGGFLGLGALTRAAAATAQNLTNNLADSLAKMPVQLVLDVVHFEGTLMLWMGPPPSDRLWLSFLEAPCMTLAARPVLGGRALRYRALLGHISSLLTSKITRGLHTAMVFPACVDVKLKFFSNADNTRQQLPMEFPPSVMAELAQVLVAGMAGSTSTVPVGIPDPTPVQHQRNPSTSSTHGQNPVGGSLAGAAVAANNDGSQDKAQSITPPVISHKRTVSSGPVAVPKPAGMSASSTPSEHHALASKSSSVQDVGNTKPSNMQTPRRGLFLGLRWRGWGRGRPAAGPPGTPGSMTPPADGVSSTVRGSLSSSKRASFEIKLPEQTSIDTAAITQTSPAFVGTAVKHQQLQNSGKPGEVEKSQPELEGKPPMQLLEDGSIGDSSMSDAAQNQNKEEARKPHKNDGGKPPQPPARAVVRGAAVVAGQSIRGLAWLGGAVARGLTRSGGRRNDNKGNAMAAPNNSQSDTPKASTGVLDSAMSMQEGGEVIKQLASKPVTEDGDQTGKPGQDTQYMQQDSTADSLMSGTIHPEALREALALAIDPAAAGQRSRPASRISSPKGASPRGSSPRGSSPRGRSPTRSSFARPPRPAPVTIERSTTSLGGNERLSPQGPVRYPSLQRGYSWAGEQLYKQASLPEAASDSMSPADAQNDDLQSQKILLSPLAHALSIQPSMLSPNASSLTTARDYSLLSAGREDLDATMSQLGSFAIRTGPLRAGSLAQRGLSIGFNLGSPQSVPLPSGSMRRLRQSSMHPGASFNSNHSASTPLSGLRPDDHPDTTGQKDSFNIARHEMSDHLADNDNEPGIVEQVLAGLVHQATPERNMEP